MKKKVRLEYETEGREWRIAYLKQSLNIAIWSVGAAAESGLQPHATNEIEDRYLGARHAKVHIVGCAVVCSLFCFLFFGFLVFVFGFFFLNPNNHNCHQIMLTCCILLP